MGRKQPAGGEVMNTAPIVMYSTKFCPFCMRARYLLDQKGWGFEEISVDRDQEKRIEMMQKSGRHTVPQIWIGDTHVGGCDELLSLERSGQLDTLVTGANDE